MDIRERVYNALIGFYSLFNGAEIYSYDKVITDAVRFAEEEIGISSNPDTPTIRLTESRACIHALDSIQSILTMSPKVKKNAEESVEFDYFKSIDILRKSYQKREQDSIDELKDNGVTFTLINAGACDE